MKPISTAGEGLSVIFEMRQLLIILLLCGSGVLSAEPRLAPSSARESAVRQARAGDAKGALHILQALLRDYPGDPELLADTTIVANWAGADDYALTIYGCKETPKDDAGVVEAAARSARNLHRYDLALQLFRNAETLSPDRWQPRLGYAMVLTDRGEYRNAAELMQPLLLARGGEPDVERGEAYLCMQQRDFACAIAMDQRLLRQGPQYSGQAQCQMAQALSQLGGDSLAQQMCQTPEGAEDWQLKADSAAEDIRWAEAFDEDWQKRMTYSKQALELLNGVIAKTQLGDAVWRQAQSDRLLALADLNRAREVIESWEQLRKMGVAVPDYALTRVAGAYLAVHRPVEAEALYRELVQRVPDEGGVWDGLAYAEFEREHIRTAFQTIDHAYASSPAWLQSPGLKVPQPNRFRTSLGLQAAEMRGDAGMPAQEQSQLSTLLGMAPANPALGRAMAMTYLARGWPLSALREERLADRFEQKSDLPVLADAEVLEGAGHRQEVDAMLDSLLKREGNSPPVNRFLRSLAIERGWQFSGLSGYERSSGEYLGNTEDSEVYLYTPLIKERWRLYAHALGDAGQFTRGSAYRSRAAVGVRYDYSRQSVWGEAAADAGTAGAVAAGAAGAEFHVGDHWIVGGEGESDSLSDVQLIAQLARVRARSGRVNMEWRHSELSSLSFSAERALYSDGNQRTSFLANWNQRILTQPRVQINLTPQLWTSTNSKDQNRIYFNPKRDWSVGAASEVNWLTWRRYEHSFRQQFTAYTAPYWEETYGFNGAVSAGYVQQWQVTDRLRLIGKLIWNGQPYDGSRQPYTDFSFGLTWGDQ